MCCQHRRLGKELGRLAGDCHRVSDRYMYIANPLRALKRFHLVLCSSSTSYESVSTIKNYTQG